MASGIIEGIGQLADIMAQIEGLDNDIQSLQRQITALFGLETALASTSALRERLAEIAGCTGSATAMRCGCKR